MVTRVCEAGVTEEPAVVVGPWCNTVTARNLRSACFLTVTLKSVVAEKFQHFVV